MSEKKPLDSEYEWIVRICTNAFNIYLTMIHFIFYDNTLNLQPQNSGIRITKTEERNKSLISTYNCKSKSDMCDSAKDEQTTGKDAGDVQGYQERIKQSERRPCDFALFPTSRTTSYGLLFPCRRDAESSD
ncbi:PREDICTED: uncharacterized protein LOC108752331 isoform X1 [Trachymyrmex septentrionalis]|uniref:uncharacterized protein LOC108752331 isoform X1 n=1 Tax=Trachymyrmex septentrionalis TaxID=34720 RepID=UPI00084F5C95|nr:PREDICTED: uncharacterized protein LOC108752331 isoform X1 [Trachymyrmex septentrionalis]